MSMDDEVAEVLAQVVALGPEPTTAELALGAAVAQHIAERPARPAPAPVPADRCPFCGRGGEP